jgi:hypothetical protein
MLLFFRLLSLPFFKIFNLFYRWRFQIKPLGQGIFEVEKFPRLYHGPDLETPDGCLIKNGERVFFLHLKGDALNKIFNGEFAVRKILDEILELSMKELAFFSENSGHNFVAFFGKTPVRFFDAENYGFVVTPLGNGAYSLEASLAFLFLSKPRRRFPKRRFYQYVISRKFLEERFGEKAISSRKILELDKSYPEI